MSLPRSRASISALLLLIAGVLPGTAAETIQSVQNVAIEWTRVRAETVRLETTWQAQNEILQSTLRALQARVEALEQRRDLLDAQSRSGQEETARLTVDQTAATSAWDGMSARIEALGAALVRLRPSLPPRLSEALELPYRSLAEPEANPAEKVQLIVTMLNRCLRFNATLTLSEEILAAGEPDRLVEVIYWGLSHAYAVDRTRGKAYHGFTGENGWTWEARDDLAANVATLVDVYRDHIDPEYVALPAQIQHPETQGAER